jgi:hypothetical protein
MKFDCEAYEGLPAAAAEDALCFFAEPGKRVCDSRPSCEFRMAAERQRVFRQIHQRAAEPTGEAIDEAYAYLATEFTDPEQLLGGNRSYEQEEEE